MQWYGAAMSGGIGAGLGVAKKGTLGSDNSYLGNAAKWGAAGYVGWRAFPAMKSYAKRAYVMGKRSWGTTSRDKAWMQAIATGSRRRMSIRGAGLWGAVSGAYSRGGFGMAASRLFLGR
jgi:hypothetical protein